MLLNLLKTLASRFIVEYKKALLLIVVKDFYDPIITIVGGLKGSTMIDDAKRDAAFKEINALVIKSGQSLKDNAIHTAISLAIDVLKGRV